MTRGDIGACIAIAALVAVLAGITAFEHLALNWHFAREMPPGDGAWHWARGGIAALLSMGTIFALARAGSARATPAPHGAIVIGWSVLLFSILLNAVLLASPAAYRALGEEDSFVEWLSATALLAGSVFSAAWLLALAARAPRAPYLHLLGAGGFTILFFIMGMEEISWGQRLFGFATPEGVAAGNWQGEFNLHNMQTDLSELALYAATGLFLVILPLLRERLHRWQLVAPFVPLLPDRSVALVSAPMLAFTYARWDLLPMQAIYFGGLAACWYYAATARAAGRRREAKLFAAICLFLVVGEAIMLLAGHTMKFIYDESEFREAILAVGIGWFGWRQWRATRSMPRAERSAPILADRLTGAP